MEKTARRSDGLAKAATGITGLDEITLGGLPRNRVTLVCGGPGCGKTLFGLEFVVRGCLEYGENAVFMSFEEPVDHLTANVRSLGFDLPALVDEGRLILDRVRLDRRQIAEAGQYDLEGLFIRLDHAIGSVGAKRVVLDTIETLFSAFPDEAILRSELRRLFGWLDDRGVTSVVTGERGERTLTRHGLEEYVSDCVITLDNRIHDEVSTRRMRVVKYRGSMHGSNEYPFIVDGQGISVLPITSLSADLQAPSEHFSTGVPRLDGMLGGEGPWRGSCILVTGHSGTGKSTLANTMVHAACARGERVLLVLLEESQAEMLRNMSSVGIDLGPMIQNGVLHCHADRPGTLGLETYLARLHKQIQDFEPEMVAVDAATALSGDPHMVTSAMRRQIDLVKRSGATMVMTSLAPTPANSTSSHAGVSSMIDTWIVLSNIEAAGERNRSIQVLKARGISNSNQVREFGLGPRGIELRDVYVGRSGVLMGAARLLQEADDRARLAMAERHAHRRSIVLEHRRAMVEAQMAAMRAEMEAEVAEHEASLADEQMQRMFKADVDSAMTTLRGGTNGDGTGEPS